MRQREGFHWFRRWRPTPQQELVLDALLDGKTNAEIADELGISADGAKWHVSQLLGETGLQDRGELAAWWRGEREVAGPRRALGFVFGWAARLALLAPVVALTVWLVVSDPRSSGGRPDAGSREPAAAPAVVAALPSPAPSPTPSRPSAWVFDIAAGEVRPVQLGSAFLQWLDEDHFLGQAGPRAVVVDREGNVVSTLADVTVSRTFPMQGQGKAIVWDEQAKAFFEVGWQAGTTRRLLELGPEPRPERFESTRAFDVAPLAGLIALAEARDGQVSLEVMGVDGGGRRTLRSWPADVWAGYLGWDGRGSMLFVGLSSRTLVDNRFQDTPAAVLVFDRSGRLLLEREVEWSKISWLGPGRLLIQERPAASGQPGPARVIEVASGREAPAPLTERLICTSPDGRYGVYRPASSSGERVRHRVVELASGDPVLESETRTELAYCDWSDDSARVVLSPGGK